MADPSEVDAAVVSRLLNDATLTSLLPDGVFWDVASANATRFAIVSLTSHETANRFGGTAYDVFTYFVKAVVLGSSGTQIKAAAARIHTLLQDTTALTPTGYTVMNCELFQWARATEPDEDADTRWQHRGGYYRLMVQPN